MNELVLTERADSVAIVTLNNPKTRNALSRDLLLALADHLEALRVDASCRALVLTGAEGHFCSGGDISGMSAERPLPVGRERMVIAHRVVRTLTQMGKPVVGAVEGYAAGAGFSLAAACDYLVASKSARFVSSFAKVGLIPDLGLMYTLPQRIGLAQAKRILMSSQKVEAEEAQRLGLTDSLVEPGETVSAAVAIARELGANAPMSVALLKAAYARGMTTLEEALAYEMDNQAALYLTKDHREAVAAFAEKRAPSFQGL
ncbi:enoyl-CoA hydratase-related protein [Paraburkholderia phymatum]|uniref:enoyl-CoA hydratase/isomerase family protein n=1 Tax=Paraburkholderia phymatum TaxID=148447 RepID=UPI00317888DD